MGNFCNTDTTSKNEQDLSNRSHPENQKQKPVVAQNFPYKVAMVKGQDYYWCSCGKSTNQPFCDGSHKGTTFKPMKITWEKESGDGYLCGCKHAKGTNQPFCDGSHNNPIDW